MINRNKVDYLPPEIEDRLDDPERRVAKMENTFHRNIKGDIQEIARIISTHLNLNQSNCNI